MNDETEQARNTKRRIGVRGVFVALSFLGGVTLGCKSNPIDNVPPVQNKVTPQSILVTPEATVFSSQLTISPDLGKLLGKKGIDEVYRAFYDYKEAYGCPVNVSLRNSDFSNKTVYSPDGKKRTSVKAEASSGLITIDFNALVKNMSEEAKFQPIRFTMLNMLTIACRYNNIGGLSNSTFNEAVADALAHYLEPYYQSPNPQVESVAALVTLVVNKWSSPQKLAEISQNNDVWGFTELFTGGRTDADLRKTNEYFRRVLDGKTEGLIDEINNRHK